VQGSGQYPPPSRRSRRLTFSYSTTDVTDCEVSEPIDMIAPPLGLARPKEEENSGSWVELRDEDGDVLFCRRVHDPFRRYAEGFADGTIDAVQRAVVEDEFEVIVPDVANVRTIAVVSSELTPDDDPEAQGRAAWTIRSFAVSPERWG
jgi:hypothetical protein